ncbi:MAG: TonB family protein [Pseudomonadota bacterium]
MQELDLDLPDISPVTSTDRLGLTLFFAVVLHAMIILGITFGTEDPERPLHDLPTLEITVATRETQPPEEAEYLAQTSQDGGGNVTEKVRPQQALPESAPAVQPQQPAPTPTRVITTTQAPRKVVQEDKTLPDTDKKEPTASELIKRSMEMVHLSEQLNESMQAYAHRPRQVFVSARTREFKYANYMSEWVRKVERVGNLNYPDAARRQSISGKLLLDVALNPDGTVRNISVLRPSGEILIDEAAIRIVNQAAPFAPFPPAISKEADVLHITRTWEFSTNNRMQSR